MIAYVSRVLVVNVRYWQYCLAKCAADERRQNRWRPSTINRSNTLVRMTGERGEPSR